MKKQCIGCIKTIGDSTRVEIYFLLSKKGAMSVNDVVEFLEVKQPTVSHHLKKLESQGLLSSKKTGKKVMYKTQTNCTYDKTPCILQVK